MAQTKQPYEFFEHTADIGIRANGRTLSELFTRMAQGLVELIAEDSALEPLESRPIELSAEDAKGLLLAWLQELLFWFSTTRFLPVRVQFEEMTPTMLRGRVIGQIFDPLQHVQGREVKAITRHLIEIQEQDGVWHGQVIVDI